jgi:hypothetical protein
MSETTAQTLFDEALLRCTMICIHTVQLILAVIVVSFDAYGVGYVAYNVLICSLIVVS